LLLCAHVGASTSLLQPVGVHQPHLELFPPTRGHHLPPAHTEVVGPKATNKFWVNWVVGEGTHLSIYPMPYTLQWGPDRTVPELFISLGSPVHTYGDQATNGPERVLVYRTPFQGEFALGAVEAASNDGHVVVRESLFGVHVEVRGPQGTLRKITFPIFSGAAYVSGRYRGGFTPRITARLGLSSVQRLRPGVWSLRNGAGVEFRAYALTTDGEFVDASFDFDAAGRLNQPLDGWLRLALLAREEDAATLDAHAQALVVGCMLEVETGGLVRYVFEKAGLAEVPLLHWAFPHHLQLLLTEAQGQGQRLATGLAALRAPTKGLMTGIVGDTWTFQADLSDVNRLGFLPEHKPPAEEVDFLRVEAVKTLEYFRLHWRVAMLKGSFYFSGKGFQKVGTVCLLLEEFLGVLDDLTQECAGLLASGFKCLYDRERAGDCTGVPMGNFYDLDWGGAPSREGYSDAGCRGADFGNACYNDHHYHFGYFVVSAAILARLLPAYRSNARFVEFVNTLIRDTTNPNAGDQYFPMFRSFDWFDFHSWSRGVVPSAEGKDQESTSEELNLLYGLHLWGAETGNQPLQQLGATMLALCTVSVREYFLMEHGNLHHHPDFVRNHATGIFFQNQVHYTTWFGWKEEYIHGIQMLPLSPALLLTRKATFVRQEWDDILSGLPLPLTDPWTSVILTGALAIIEPPRAYQLLLQMNPGHVDDGLTRVWALYWAAVQQQGNNTAASTTRAGATTTVGTTTTGGEAQTSTTPPCHEPSSTDLAACGHSNEDCASHGAEHAFFTASCLHGGLGCQAWGRACCRFCGFGAYAEVLCPIESRPCPPGTDSTSSTTATVSLATTSTTATATGSAATTTTTTASTGISTTIGPVTHTTAVTTGGTATSSTLSVDSTTSASIRNHTDPGTSEPPDTVPSLAWAWWLCAFGAVAAVACASGYTCARACSGWHPITRGPRQLTAVMQRPKSAWTVVD